MTDRDLARRVSAALDADVDEFEARAAAEGERLKELLAEGVFDNDQTTLGLEHEFYGVDDTGTDGSLRRLSRSYMDLLGLEKELGLHNVEMTVSPQPVGPDGLRATRAEVDGRLRSLQRLAAEDDVRLVSDGLWTAPPAGERSSTYLTDASTVEGVRLATNMSDAVRYHAIANGPVDRPFTLRAPHVTLDADTVLPESLITSIQPHYQPPTADDLPLYADYAARVAAPLLALGANSPLFPADLYDGSPPERILADAWASNRIAVFESVLNSAGPEKVRFPEPYDSVEEAVDLIVDDGTIAPLPEPDADGFDGQFATFDLKRATFWRWVRPVFDGASPAAANARIEFRPVGAQPTVADTVSVLATFVGLMEALPANDHPLVDLPWETARDNFYAAARDGTDADIEWVTPAGRSSDSAVVYADLFDQARQGLVGAGVPPAEADDLLRPLRGRARLGVSPAEWRLDRAFERLNDGASLAEAIADTRRRYLRLQSNTLHDGSFLDWL